MPVAIKETKTPSMGSDNFSKGRTNGRVAALWALVFFVVINGGLSIWAMNRVSRKPEQRGATFLACSSAIEQYENLKSPPAVVLMGSSLMMAPVWSVDFKRFPKIPNVYLHHRSLRLSELLQRAGFKNTDVFSFGLPGAMVSDMYLICNKLFDQQHKPGLIVLGLSPRDFMDDLLTGETRTAVFQQLMTLEDLPKTGDLYLATGQEKTDFVVNHTVFLYGKRWRYQDKIASVLRSIYGLILPVPAASRYEQNDQQEQKFLTDGNREEVWRKSIEEYSARYKHFNETQFQKQESFLAAILDLCQKRSIRIVLVAMPLSDDNIHLMPNKLYETYISTIQNLSNRYNCPIITCPGINGKDKDSFYDTVHLNAHGGDKLLTELSKFIAKTGSDN